MFTGNEYHIVYRQASPADCDLCFLIKTRSIKPYVSAVYGWNEDFQLNFHRTNFHAGNIRLLAFIGTAPERGERTESGETAETVFGYLETECRKNELHLVNVLIDETFQGQGLGTAVLENLLAEAASKRLRVRLEVFRVNRRAQRFYRRLGFRETGGDRIKRVMEKG